MRKRRRAKVDDELSLDFESDNTLNVGHCLQLRDS